MDRKSFGDARCSIINTEPIHRELSGEPEQLSYYLLEPSTALFYRPAGRLLHYPLALYLHMEHPQ